MAININTNAQSLFAQNAVNKSTLGLQRSIEKLSTGFRINRAADDAAGLSMSETLTAQIRGYGKAKQNVGDGISLLQTAEGALGSIQDNMQRIRELLVQAGNGSNGNSELDAIQNEINALVNNISDIGTNTEFNNISLLAGTANITLQTGANDGETTAITLQSGTATAASGIDVDITLEANSATNGDHGHLVEGVTNGFSLDEIYVGGTVDSVAGNAANTALTLTDADTILGNVSRMRSELGALQNSLESKMDYLSVAEANATTAKAHIKDADIAKESSNLVRNQILQQSATAILSQANAAPQVALSLLP